MTIDADIRDQAYQFFIQEAPELLYVIETELVNLAQGRSTNKIHNMMRAAHSLKGGAASVGLPVISQLSHRLEDFFKTLHHEELVVDRELEGLLLETFDLLQLSLSQQIDTGNIDPDRIAEVAAPILTKIEAKLGDFLGSETELPNSIDLGVDIALSIFEVDVAEGLERLRDVLDHPQDHVVIGELRAQAEVFSGISELLNMPGLGEIAQATIAALDANPEMVVEIAHYAMQDFEAARQGVIAGDRTQGGHPSLQLLEMANPELLPIDFNDLDDLLGISNPATDLDLVSDSLSYSLLDLSESNQILSEPAISPLTSLASSLISDDLDLDDLFSNSFSDSEHQKGRDLTELSTEFTNDSVDDFVDTVDLDDIFGTVYDLEESESDRDHQFEVPDSPNVPSGSQDSQLALGLDDVFGEVENFDANFGLDNLELDDVFNDDLPIGDRIIAADLSLSEDLSIPMDSSGDLAIDLPVDLSMDLSMDDVFSENIPFLELGSDLTVDAELLFTSSITDAEIAIPSKDFNSLLLDDVFGMDNPQIDLSEIAIVQDISPEAIIIGDKVLNDKTSKNFTEPDSIANTSVDFIPTSANVPAKFAKYTTPAISAPTAIPEAQLSVRINLDRLEDMNNLVGELAINRNVLSSQNEQLQGIIQELLRRFGKFKQISQNLRNLADRSAAGDRLRNGNITLSSGSSTQSQSSAQLSEGFDSLELDSYGELYGVMQTALEDLAQIEETVEDVTLLSGQSVQTLEQQRQTVTRLRDDLMWARMLPLSEVLNRFPRNIRDLSNKYQKPVDLKLSGTGVLVDKAILEKLTDPLQHLLRNAFDHGIEPSEVRLSQNKSDRGQIEIRAYHQGSQTIIEVRDDGQGINLEQIRRKAISQALISAEQEFTDPQLLDLMFQPGFSTTDRVSELSGRGVGLDVVRSQIQALKGSVSVAFERGQGTTFILRIPLTLSVANLLIITVGTNIFAIASSSIEEIVVPKSSQVKLLEVNSQDPTSPRQRLLQWREREIPIRHLSEFLDFHCPLPENLPNTSLVSVPTPSDWALPLLIVRSNRETFALEIDRLITEQELTIKPLGIAIAPPKFIYGSTILGDGSLIPIIDSQALLEREQLSPLDRTIPTAPKITPTQSDTLLIVDDSIALRQTLALTLQKVGFRVLQAKNGLEAIEQLEKNSTIQLVICDVEMPDMNGFEFLTHRRQNPDLNKTPVVMLTSRSSDKHRRLALHLGATSYFTKPYLEREFIAAIRNILHPAALT